MAAPVVPHKPPPKPVQLRERKPNLSEKAKALRLSASMVAPPPSIADPDCPTSPPKVPKSRTARKDPFEDSAKPTIHQPIKPLVKPPNKPPSRPPAKPPAMIPPTVPTRIPATVPTRLPPKPIDSEPPIINPNAPETPLSPKKPEPTKKEKKRASITIQTAYRCWRQRKAYKILYEKRKWTLHKEANVLTNHVTKSRVSGRPGRRPPTRGKRVVGLEKPTYEPKRITVTQASDDSGAVSSPGPTRAAPRMAARPMTTLGGGIMFDPSAVKLKSSPKVPRANTDKPGPTPSPFDNIRKNLRPTTQFGAAPVSPVAPKSRSAGDVGSAPSFVKKENLSIPPSTPPSKVPPKPIGGKKPPMMPISFTPPEKGNEEVKKSESLPEFMLSPRSGKPMRVDRKKKRKAKSTLTSFLTRRPQKDQLVSKGILKGEAAEAYPELGDDFHKQNSAVEKERPVMQHGRTCITPGCGKKLKGRKNNNCYRCGHVFCKNCLHKTKEFMPEFKYDKPHPICDICFHERKKELIQQKADYLKKIAENIS